MFGRSRRWERHEAWRAKDFLADDSSLLLFSSVSRLKASWEALKEGQGVSVGSAYCTMHNAAFAQVGQCLGF